MSEGCSPEVDASMNQEEQALKSDERADCDNRLQKVDKNLASSPGQNGKGDDQTEEVKGSTTIGPPAYTLPPGETFYLQQHHQEKASFHGSVSKLTDDTVSTEHGQQPLASSAVQKQSNCEPNTPLQGERKSATNSTGSEQPQGLWLPNCSVPVGSSASPIALGVNPITYVPGFAAPNILTGLQVSASSPSLGINNFQVFSAGSLRIVLPTTQPVQLTADAPNRFILTVPSAQDKFGPVSASQSARTFVYSAQPGIAVHSPSAQNGSANLKRNLETSAVSLSNQESECQSKEPSPGENGVKVMKVVQGNPTQPSPQPQPACQIVMNNVLQNSANLAVTPCIVPQLQNGANGCRNFTNLSGHISQASTKLDEPSTKVVKIVPQASPYIFRSVLVPSMAMFRPPLIASGPLVTAPETNDVQTQQSDSLSVREDVMIKPVSQTEVHEEPEKVADGTENVRSKGNRQSGADSPQEEEMYDGPIVINYRFIKSKPEELKEQRKYKPKESVATVKRRARGRSKGAMTHVTQLDKLTNQLPIVPVKQNKRAKKKPTDVKKPKPIEYRYRVYNLKEVQRSEGFTREPREKTDSSKRGIAWLDMTKSYQCKICSYATTSPRSICHHLIESHREFTTHLHKALSSEKLPRSQAVLLDFVLGKDMSASGVDNTDGEANGRACEKLLEEKSDGVESDTSGNEPSKMSTESPVSDFATDETTLGHQSGVHINGRQVERVSYSQLSNQSTVQNVNNVIPDGNSEEMQIDCSEQSGSSNEQNVNEALLDETANHKQIDSTFTSNGKQPDSALKTVCTASEQERGSSDIQTVSLGQSDDAFEDKVSNQSQASGTCETTEINKNKKAANGKQSDSACDINTSNLKREDGTSDTPPIDQEKQSDNTSDGSYANRQQPDSASDTPGPNHPQEDASQKGSHHSNKTKEILSGEPSRSSEEVRYLDTDTLVPLIRKYASIIIHCPKCDLKFRMFKLSDRHHCERTNRDVLCEECGKVFSLSCYRRHYRLVHRGGKKAKCEFCQKEFVKTSLKQHIRKFHSGKNRKVACSMCGKLLASHQQLHKHEAIHRTEMPHKCPICNRGFTQRTNMVNHMRQHTGEQPYKCDHCTKCFTHRVSLKTHLKKYHGIDLWKQGQTGGGRPKKTK